jgi:hypothetical protein
VGVDTVVESAGVILEKPDDAQHALRMLQSLSGGRHSVHTGVALKFMDGSSHVFHETTHIEFATVSTEVKCLCVCTHAPSANRHAWFRHSRLTSPPERFVERKVFVVAGGYAGGGGVASLEEHLMLISPWTRPVALAFKVVIALPLHFLHVTFMTVSSRRGRSIHIWHQRLLLRKRSQVCVCMRARLIPFSERHGAAAAQILRRTVQVLPTPCIQCDFMYRLEAF